MTQAELFPRAGAAPSEVEPLSCELPASGATSRQPPEGMEERAPAWHFEKLVEFTAFKKTVGEPSPHLAMVGHMSRDDSPEQRVWMLGCYAATYCLPSAQVIWTEWPWPRPIEDPAGFAAWVGDNWPGIVTRTERRCVRSLPKMVRCLSGYATWARDRFPGLAALPANDAHEYYDAVWNVVMEIPFFGRYIGIRLIEGLKRYCGVPAHLYDIRSIGGWSPKLCLCYFYPERQDVLLRNTAEANAETDAIAEDLLSRVREREPWVSHYVIAAMLCEYREAFERRHQYAGWTIDQEPLMYDKVAAYWGDTLDRGVFWGTRAALFPPETLGEVSGAWNGTRWALTKTLRDHGYNWTDMRYDFAATLAANAWDDPVRRLAPR